MSAGDLASRLALHRAGATWRGSCPVCGYGADAFCLTAKGGRVRGWCASCDDRDAISNVLTRLEGGEAVQRPDVTTHAPVNTAQRTAEAVIAWTGAVPAQGTPADLYLTSRALSGLAASAALRWRPDVAHPSGGGRHPAMVALVVDVSGAPLAVHRTYLDRNGRKADLEPVKASKGPIAGGAIRLDPLAAEIVIGEGIETSASAGRLLQLPAWAAVSAGNLANGLVLPVGVRSVVIAADHDELTHNGKKPGQEAAQAAAARWRAEGRFVRIATPDRPGDFNDLLLMQGRHG